MDRDQVFQLARHWYPVFAAILSSLLNFLAFMIGINWNPTAIVQMGLLSLLGTMIVSGLVILALQRMTLSAYTPDSTILSSNDEYLIENPQKALYKRTVNVKVNQSSSILIAYPPSVDGELSAFRAYQSDNPSLEYIISNQKVSGRKSLYIDLGHHLQSGEIITGLCIECQMLNSFGSELEGVSVGADPGQEICKVKIFLPEHCPPVASKAEWFVLYGRNPTPIKNGVIDTYRVADGKYVINHDFSNDISHGIGFQCAISWRWKPAQMCANGSLPLK